MLALPQGVASASTQTFVVTSTADDNNVCDTSCTLREAIGAANATAELDTISFDVPTPATITVATALPIVSRPTIIDATTLPGYSGTPRVSLLGRTATGTRVSGAGLRLDGAGSRLEGLAINGFSDAVVLVGGGGSTVARNHMGVNAEGTAAVGNSQTGVLIAGSNDNVIRANLIGGNHSGVGMHSGATRNTITGNAIGTDFSGTFDLGNRGEGVFSFADLNTIGGTQPAAGNVIANSGQRTDGVTAPGVYAGAQRLSILGNRIWSSSGAGIHLDGAANGGQAAPTITAVTSDGTSTTVTGSAAGTGEHRLELFTNDACDAGGSGEGKNFVGAATITAGSSFSATIAAPVAANAVATATTTSVVSGNTSAFSACKTASASASPLRVNTTTDSTDAEGCNPSHCSLREAVTAANTRPGTDEISFAISGVAPHVITLSGALPTLTQPASIDATSEPDYAGTPVVVIGAGAVPVGSAALTISGGASTVRGLAVNGMPSGASGIWLQGQGGNTISDSFVGTNAAGTAAALTSGRGHGIRISNTSAGGHTIRRNLISGNNLGLWVGANAHGGHTIQGNLVGTDAAGTSVVRNERGIVFEGDAGGNTVGGLEAAHGNVISGNGQGLALSGSSNNVVVGNKVGTDKTGMRDLGNEVAGVSVSQTTIGTVRPAENNKIGGPTEAERNLISGNGAPGAGGTGVVLNGTTNRLQGNWIGTDATGNSPLGNERGVDVLGIGMLVGGTQAGAGNVVAGNGENGIQLSLSATGTRVWGNRIGVGADGSTQVGNKSAGVFANLSGTEPTDNVIGGTATGAGNVVSGNGAGGIYILRGRGVSVSGNSIFGQVPRTSSAPALGIDLDPIDATANDVGDSDTGANDLQNSPVIAAEVTDGQVRAEVFLDSTPNASHRVELFANGACDAIRPGEGKRFLSAATLATDAAGRGSVLISATLATGETLSATATNAAGSTSELSACHEPTARQVDSSPPVLEPTVSPNPVERGATATADPGATDPESGIASSSCDAVDTSTTGTFSVECRATNGEGLSNTASASYTVTEPPLDQTAALVWHRQPGGIWMGAPGGSPTRIVDGDAMAPSWSPDRSMVAFAGNRDGSWDIWTVEVATGALSNVTNDAFTSSKPAWSPDGSRIAFASSRDGDYEIFTIRPDGTGLRQLTHNDGYDSDPAWSPDGKRLVYIHTGGLSLIDPDGSGNNALLTTSAMVGDPTWSPDGSRIAYSGLTSGGGEIFTIRPDGSDVQQITDDPSTAMYPTWSPDGRAIAFTSLRSGDYEVWAMRPDGSAMTNISNEVSATDLAADWGQTEVTPPPSANLSVSFATEPTSVTEDSDFTVSGTVSNSGTGNAGTTRLLVESAGGAITGVTSAGASCTVTSPTAATCALGTLAANTTRSFAVNLHSGSPGPAKVTGTLRCSCDDLADGQPSTWSGTITTAPPTPTLSIAQTGPTAAVQGDPLTYHYTITNSLGRTATGVSVLGQSWAVADSAFAPVESVVSSKGTCSTSQARRSPTGFTWRCGWDLAPGETVNITVTTGPSVRPGTLGSAAQVSCACTDPDNRDNFARVDTKITPKADLTLKIAGPTTVAPAKPITWTGTVLTNTTSMLRQVVTEWIVPEGVTVSQVATDRYTTCSTSGRIITCIHWTVTNSSSVSIVVIPARGGTYALTGRIVSCDCVDPNPGDNSAVSRNCVAPPISDLSVTKGGPTRAETGDLIRWTIDVTNYGPDAARSVTIKDTLPLRAQFRTATADQGKCTFASGTVTCQLGTVPVGHTARIVIEAVAIAPSTLSNTAQMTCDCYDQSTTNNSSTAPAVTVWPIVGQPTVATCDDYGIPGVCRISVTLPNANPGPLAGGTVKLWAGTGTGSVTMVPGGSTKYVPCSTGADGWITCTVTSIPAGGRTIWMDVYANGTGTWSPRVIWDCTCTDTGPRYVTPPPMTPDTGCVGGQVLFDTDNSPPLLDVYAATLDGDVQELSASSGNEEAGAVWSPDHRRFAMHVGLPEARKLYVVDLDAAGCIISQSLIPNQPAGDNYQPDWSPDGRMLAFVSSFGGNHNIWRINIDGSDLKQLTSHSADDRAPSFSADGRRVAFSSQRAPRVANSDWNIWTTDTAGTQNEQFLSASATGYVGGGADYSPSFSRTPGTSTILWHTNSGGNWDLWLMNADGTNKRRIPNATAAAEKNADWALGDSRIVYDAGPNGGNADIWMMRTDGTNRHVIAATPGHDKAPSL